MTLDVRLLGTPCAERDGSALNLRGTKGWILLAYLVTADRPVPRQRLANLLFPEAKDPSGALRWNLSQLRRELDLELDGDPLALRLPEDALVDLVVLKVGAATDAVDLERFGEDLLVGVDDPANEPLMTWLDGERRHVRGMAVDVLREAALVHRSRGEPEQAVRLAEACAGMDPLDENTATLLVRCLREVGRASEAIEVAEAARHRLQTQLGVTPSSALWAAAHAPIDPQPTATNGRLTVEALLETGEAAIAAGAIDAGIDTLREALGASRILGEADLVARCLTGLGSALIHAVRGTDQDGVALLHDALPLAEAAGLRSVAAHASRELGYVDMLRARYERAAWWFEQTRELADGDDEERAWLGAFAGAARTDVADFDGAARWLEDAVDRADAAGAVRAGVMARSMRGRMHLLAGDLEAAGRDLDAAVAGATGLGWRSHIDWPQTLRAEVLRQRGDAAGAREILERSLVSSRQIADPCWEAMALSGLGRLAVEEGRLDEGLELLEEAPRQCRRLPDTYRWVEVFGLDALADVTSNHGMPTAPRWVRELGDASSTHGMRDLNDNAAEYLTRLA